MERRTVILLDTHTLLWWRNAPSRLGRAALRACERTPVLGVSAITFWEVGMLADRGRVNLRAPLSEWTRDVLQGERIEGFPVTPEIAALAGSLSFHGDPADRIIVATALDAGCKLVTRDDVIARANVVDTVWD